MAEKKLGAVMKAAQKFPKIRLCRKGPNNEGWTEKALRKTKALIP